MQARRGELIDALGDGGLLAEVDGQPSGLICWRVESDVGSPSRGRAEAARRAEITSLAVARQARGLGVGRALLDAATRELRAVGVERVWLVTTNDNLTALALYQKSGYRLSALRAGAVDATRRTIKPTIGEIGEHGIPLRDELELELSLDSPA
jgi:ribosomal protein S18 acetylase RimI-like enzyme